MNLADRLEALAGSHREDWHVAQEPHDYKDGTDHFTHVRYTSDKFGVTVEVASYLTPELAELLCLLHNNADLIVRSLRGIHSGQASAQANYPIQSSENQGLANQPHTCAVNPKAD